jgi:exonuclease SbcD
MIKFIHTADVHFGMENYGKIDQKTGIHSRLLDFNKALNFCIDRGIDEKIDFFLFAGDAYKTANPSPTQQRLLMRSLLRLHEKNIPVIIIVGNHDNPLSFGKANALDIFGDIPLEGFHVIAKPMILKLATKTGPVQIVGIPWPTRNTIAMNQQHLHKSAHEITEYISKAVTTIITDFARQLDPNIPSVLSSHLTVSSGIFSGSEKRAVYGNDPLFLPSQLAIPPFDYVGLGHLHRHQNLNPNGYPAVVYSGSIERVDFGERKEDKGFCLVQIEEKGKTSYEFIKTPMRPFIQIEAHLEAGDGQTEQLLQEIKKYNITDAVVKILYHIPPGKKDRVDLPTIQNACSAALYVVGILPIRTPEKRERRANMKVDMDLASILTSYFESKEELKEKKDLLIQKTLELEAEACEHEEQQ